MRTFQLLIFSILLCIPYTMVGQNIPTTTPKTPHLDLFTQRAMSEGGYLHGRENISLFVKGEPTGVKAAVLKVKGKYKFGYGDLHSVTIPQIAMDEFLSDVAIAGAENGDIPMKLLMDTSRIVNNIVPIHNGMSPLSQSYKGEGVIVGVIDEGIDLTHPDFQHADGKTRIQFLWDQNAVNNNPPMPYDYGMECTKQEIDNGLCPHVEVDPNTGFPISHGSNVTGALCADDKGSGDFMGVAPKADMIIVNFDFDAFFLSGFVDAVDYIFKKADAMGKPCVINASMGTYYGSRDARDFASCIVDEMLEERCGRSLVCAFGNEGGFPYHLGYDLDGTDDTFFTWFQYIPSEGDLFWQVWADTTEFQNVNFSLGADDPNTWDFLGRTQYINIRDYELTEAEPVKQKSYTVSNVNGFVGSVLTQATLDVKSGTYLWEVIINPNSPDYYWRFETTGSDDGLGRFDIWSDQQIMGSSEIVLFAPSVTIFPDSVRYKSPDTDMTQVSSFTNSDKVITVGNHENRSYYVDVKGDTQHLVVPQTGNTPVIPGNISYTSAWGPTRDGRIKPDVTASGSTTLSTGNIAFIQRLLSSGQSNRVAHDSLHMRNGGTSLASPIVAGIVALYLEQYPDACYHEIKQAIIECAITDTFTGATPNYRWGYGKVDGFCTMQKHVVYGCMDPTALNYDSSATYSDNSCITKIVGCTDPQAENYDSLANFDDGSCTFVGIDEIAESISLGFYPNPFNGTTQIVYQLKPGMAGSAELVINNLLGQEIDRITLQDQAGNISYEIPDQRKGVYLYRLIFENNTIASNKLVVY